MAAGALLAFDRREAKGTQVLAGVDEAGRGPLAGPVVAAAVIFFRRKLRLPGLNDSKKVRPEDRKTLFWEICKNALIGIGRADHPDIDRLNIYQATREAMRRAVLSLSRTPDLLMIDGNMRLDLPLPQKPVAGGDGRSAVIAAASIVAKVYRDAWMLHYDHLYPQYAFKDHKGYGTPGHKESIAKYGLSPIHRLSFSPCSTVIASEAKPSRLLRRFAPRNDKGESFRAL